MSEQHQPRPDQGADAASSDYAYDEAHDSGPAAYAPGTPQTPASPPPAGSPAESGGDYSYDSAHDFR